MRPATRYLLPLAALLAACAHQQPDPAPPADPAPTYAYSSALGYAQPRPTLTATYATANLTGTGHLSAAEVLVQLGAAAENVTIRVPRAALGTQLVGTYALCCPARPTDPARVTYVARLGPGSSCIADLYLINNCAPQPLVGDFTITAYDADRHLLAGHYRVQADHQLDPYDAHNPVPCDVALSGEFTNLKLVVD